MKQRQSLAATSHRSTRRARSRHFSCLFGALLVVFVGCSEPPAAEPEDQEVAASEEEVEVDIIDDERSVARRLEDAALATRVRLALLESKSLRPFEFEPVATNGRIQLRGSVQTQNQSREAQSIAEGVSGVSAVVNEISTSLEAAPLAAARADAPPDKEEPAPKEEKVPAAKEPARVAKEEPKKEIADVPRQVYTEGPLRPGIRGFFIPHVKPGVTPQTETPETGVAAESGQFHTVRSGDSLWEIARRYNVTVEEIRRLNGMRSNSIRPGQKIRIK